ncbi:MAG: hypothetical protein P3X22_007420 [Thermoprotei archaeon]|nr:hypothetical protein [Thermoprotei archaeon]
MKEEVKADIIKLIDENRSPWVKAAFYSDPRVSTILGRLIEEWESEGRQGIPLDYASDEELEILHETARRYAYMSDEEARSIAWSTGSKGESKGEGSFLGFIRRLLRKP